MRTFVVGDIHGAYKALKQCFERSGFDYNRDRLIALGDVCDGYPEVDLCIDELLKVKHLDYVIGNHDLWALKWATSGWKEDIWLSQGGKATIQSYGSKGIRQEHAIFLQKAPFFLRDKDRVFVHAGFDPEKPIHLQDKANLAWDRELIQMAARISKVNSGYQFGEFKEIYLGHTPTPRLGSEVPFKLCNVWAMDTGAGWGKKLSIMDTDSKKYFQSDLTSELYPNIVVRK